MVGTLRQGKVTSLGQVSQQDCSWAPPDPAPHHCPAACLIPGPHSQTLVWVQALHATLQVGCSAYPGQGEHVDRAQMQLQEWARVPPPPPPAVDSAPVEWQLEPTGHGIIFSE